MADAGAGIDWFRWIISGLTAGGVAVSGVLLSSIGRIKTELGKNIDDLSDERKRGDAALWDRLNFVTDGSSDRRVDQERYFATQKDIESLHKEIQDVGTRLEQRIKDHETRSDNARKEDLKTIFNMIVTRPPVGKDAQQSYGKERA